MRHLLLIAVFSLFSFVLCWTKEDYEIFDLVSALEEAEGKGTTFYSWLGVSSSASIPEINKAYRKKSMQLHPDKNPGVKSIHQRFARLGVINKILRDPEGRTRYDFFYKNGVPKWRGTGYYYSRFRPGLGTVGVFLVILTSLLQYLVQRMNYKKDVERIETFVRQARLAAWGPKMVPLEGARKVRISKNAYEAELGGDGGGGARSLEMLVEGDSVYLLGDDEPVLLDSSVALKPSITNTWFISAVRGLPGRFMAAKSDTQAVSDREESDTGTESESAENASSSSRKGTPSAVDKVGGRRRRVAKTKAR